MLTSIEPRQAHKSLATSRFIFGRRVKIRYIHSHPDRIIGADFENTATDIMIEVKISGCRCHVLIIIENQSTVPKNMAARILLNSSKILVNKLNQKSTNPPPVIGVVISNAAHDWTAATSLDDLIPAIKHLPKDLQRFVPRMEYIVIDLHAMTNEDIINNDELTCSFRLSLLSLKNYRSPKLSAMIEEWQPLWKLAGEHPEEQPTTNTVLRYLSAIPRVTRETVIKAGVMAGMKTQQVEESLATMWIRDGMRNGLAIQLTERFGTPAPTVQDKLNNAAEAELMTWMKNFVTASTIEDVFRASPARKRIRKPTSPLTRKTQQASLV